AMQSSLKGPAAVGLAAPLAVLTLPIFDTAAAIVRRKLTGRSIVVGDRGHLHHCLLRRGLSSRRVLLWVSTFALLTATGAWGSLLFHNELFALLSAVAVISILIVSRLFGYAECLLVKDYLVTRTARFLRAESNGRAPPIEGHPPLEEQLRPVRG